MVSLPQGIPPAASSGEDRSREGVPPKRAKLGASNAARVSRGSYVDTWGGLPVGAPQRDKTQHLTVTVVIYNTVAGGVPSAADVKAAVDDMENLYASCGWSGRLGGEDDLSDAKAWCGNVGGAGASFMKQEVNPPPFHPKGALVTAGSTFPTTAATSTQLQSQ